VGHKKRPAANGAKLHSEAHPARPFPISLKGAGTKENSTRIPAPIYFGSNITQSLPKINKRNLKVGLPSLARQCWIPNYQ